ncbi:MAG: septal ring lytic transglycosylase RlpA family protein [Halioglobus sp.]|nr:septal ring lytic transglycosylase RlpA family protein [Halioglobus sp.]
MKRVALCMFILVVSACAAQPARESATEPAAETKDATKSNYTQTGKASFYADKYQGRQTASGDLLDHAELTGAHTKLPFGTKVKVTNTDNGKSTMVIVTDRGPFVEGRIIDLTKSAFDQIGDRGKGVITVQIEVIE